MTFQGNVVGTDSLTVTSGLLTSVGTLVLSGNNSGFSGGITLMGGDLAIGSATALGTGTITLNNGTAFNTKVVPSVLASADATDYTSIMPSSYAGSFVCAPGTGQPDF